MELNLSFLRVAKWFDKTLWSDARIFTPKYLADLKVFKLSELEARHHSINGGDRETEVKLLIVIPTNSSCLEDAVTTVTPVANVPKAFLRLLELIIFSDIIRYYMQWF